ncbi:MAG: hypothetical protein KAY37_14765 [Phycisphaerae bacterium]|nr:hypothetical protein [Phycisphaerae bacterium]
MRSHGLAYRLTCLGLVAACCHAAGAAGPTDIAQFMPSETAIYIGWSPWQEQDSAELRLGQKALDAAVKLAGEDADDEEIILLSLLGEAVLDLQTYSGGIGLFDVTIVEGEPDIHAALVVEAGPDSAKMADKLRACVSQMGDPDDIERHTVKDVTLDCLQLGDTPMHLVWGVHHDCFILALGDVAAGKVIDCMNGDADNLAATPEFQFDRRKVTARLDGRFFCLYVDAQRALTRIMEVVAELAGPLPPIVDQTIEELGLTAVKSKYLHIDEVDEQLRIMGFAHVDGPLRGWLKLWDQEPLSDEDLKIVPKNAYWAEVGNLNLAGLWKETLRILDELSPEAAGLAQGSVAMSAEVLGFSITDELLPAFGDTWAFFDAPDHGGVLLTGTVLVADVENAEAVQGALAHLARLATALLRQEIEQDVTLKLKQAKHGEHTIHYVLVAGVPSPVAPAWGFVDDRWVFGLFPQTVAAAMKQVDPNTRGDSILDHPDVQAAAARLPKQIQGFSFYDSQYFTRLFYPLTNALQTLGVSMLAQYDLEIDFELMPPVSEAEAKVTNFVGTSSKDEDGVLYASLGDGVPLAVVAGSAAMVTSVMLPSLSRARYQAKTAVSLSNLRGIGQACYVYANDHDDKYPESFEEMIEEGLIIQQQLYSPLNPEGVVSYVYIAGQNWSGDVRNVLAYERVRDGEVKTNVLFLDGHAESMPIERFKQALQETYRRLEREDEIPEEFRD